MCPTARAYTFNINNTIDIKKKFPYLSDELSYGDFVIKKSSDGAFLTSFNNIIIKVDEDDSEYGKKNKWRIVPNRIFSIEGKSRFYIIRR